MTATTRFLYVLLLAATALAEDPPTGATNPMADASAACPEQTAALGTCGLGVALACPICIATSMGTDAPATTGPSNTDAFAALCDTMKSGNFCSDLDKCVEEKCPETCKGPVKELAVCTLKASGCDIGCAADDGAPPVVAPAVVTAAGQTPAGNGTDAVTPPAGNGTDAVTLPAGNGTDAVTPPAGNGTDAVTPPAGNGTETGDGEGGDDATKDPAKGNEGDDSSAYGRTSLLTTAVMCLGSLGAMMM